MSPPAEGTGTYIGDNLTYTDCFPDVGKSVNIIATVTLLGAHAQLNATGYMTGNVAIYTNQTNAACDTLTPAGAPGNLGVTGLPGRERTCVPGWPLPENRVPPQRQRAARLP